MKTCPFCAEEIQNAAVVCKHCGRDLPTSAPVIEMTRSKEAPASNVAVPFFANATILKMASVAVGIGFGLSLMGEPLDGAGLFLMWGGFFSAIRKRYVLGGIVALLLTAICAIPSMRLQESRDRARLAHDREASIAALRAEIDVNIAGKNWERAMAQIIALKSKTIAGDTTANELEAQVRPHYEEAKASREAAEHAKSVKSAVAEASAIAANKNKCETPLELSEAWKKLKTVTRADPEWTDAVAAAVKLERCRLQTAKALDAGVQTLMIAQREMWASNAEKEFLKQGMDVEISLSGRTKDVVTLKWPLMGRPTVYKLTEDGSMADGSLLHGLQKIGFRRVTFSDGFDFGNYYTLTPQSETSGGALTLKEMGLSEPLVLE